jgi:hypothetical protein
MSSVSMTIRVGSSFATLSADAFGRREGNGADGLLSVAFSRVVLWLTGDVATNVVEVGDSATNEESPTP